MNFLLAVALALPVASVAAGPTGYPQRKEVKQFIAEMVKKHRFTHNELNRVFGQAQFQPAIIKAMEQPAESALASWQAYRALFINRERIDAGVQFWNRHAEPLGRAAVEFGVPAEIIVGIIGVETTYGRNIGTYRVIDALSTLAFDYPKRAEFFRAELENYLVFTREMRIDALRVKGSYAGAIGIPQFMPGSYRRFALDYDGDGHIKLATSAASDALCALIELETPGQPSEFRVTLRNYFVLTRYNRSNLYASAVLDLAAELARARPGPPAPPAPDIKKENP